MLNSLNPLKKSLPFWEEFILAFWCVELINWEELKSAINTKNINCETHLNRKEVQNSCIHCQYNQFYSWFTAYLKKNIIVTETKPPGQTQCQSPSNLKNTLFPWHPVLPQELLMLELTGCSLKECWITLNCAEKNSCWLGPISSLVLFHSVLPLNPSSQLGEWMHPKKERHLPGSVPRC